ncbi:SLBB domain-containing protein [Niabella aquatica]
MNLKNISKFAVGVIYCLLIFVGGVNAQNEPPTAPKQKEGTQSPVTSDVSNIKVDNMSDAQVRQMMQRMGESGMTESQLEAAAKARGMDAMEIQKFKDRAAKLKAQKDTGAENEEGERQEEEDAEKGKTAQTTAPPPSRIFGSQLFSTGFESFEPNLRMATPANYTIGPDDVLLLDLTGDNEAHYKLPVSPEGFISLEYVGRVAVGGLTIEQAKRKLQSTMSATYPALRSGRSQIALNVGNIRSIKVVINGEVTKPGTYTLPSVASVFNALYASGGPNQNGSFRNIQVIRGNNVIATVDLYDFLINGIQTGNVRLEDQDVIHIPVYQIRVDVLGEVKRSAIYEIRSGESLVDVLRYAGGFSDMAYKARVKIVQNTANAQKIIVKPLVEFPDYMPKNGDKVFVDPIFERFENKVQINGAVTRPGTFEYTPGLKLTQLIQQADGLSPDVFMNRGYIVRLNPDNTSSIIPFDVAQVLKGGASDIALQKDDMVQVTSIFDLRDEQTVTINGEVRTPGTFGYMDNMTVADVIQMAGGFKPGGSPMNIEVSRRIKGTDLTQKNAAVAEVFNVNVDDSLRVSDIGFNLKPFDIVSIRPIEGYTGQQQVQVLGEVLRPGIYTIQSKNERISDIIKRAGGLTAFAYAKGASLKRPASITNDAEEERIRILNLERLKQTGADDSTTKANLYLSNVASDLVGIELDKIMEAPQSRYDLIVEVGDIIRVPTLLQTVKVTGEVLRPISVVYKPGKPFKYYINSAGGFTRSAYKRGSFISNANGSVMGTTKVLFFNNYPAVTPGSEISVPQKVKKEGMSAQGWFGIGTAAASIAAIIFAILNNSGNGQ